MESLRKNIKKIEKVNFFYVLTTFFILILVIYGPSLFNGFVWDDEEQVLKNPIIQNIHNLPYLFTSSTFNTGGAGLSGWYYKPLMPVFFSIIDFIFGLNPFFFHLFDVLIHFLNTALLYIFLKKIFSKFNYSYSKTVSFFLAIIFLIHPGNVESVAYISGTQEVLYVFFLLVSSLLAISFLKKTAVNYKKLIFIFLFLLFSLLSKESGIVAIPVLIGLSLIYDKTKTLVLSICSTLTFAIYLILRFPIAKTPFSQHSSIIPIADASFYQRLLTVPFEIFSYFRIIFLPIDLFVSQHMVIKSLSDPKFYLSFIFVLFLICSLIFIYFRFKSKLFLFFFTWASFSLIMILNIYPLDMTIAERWLYGPMVCFLGLGGLVILELEKRKNRLLEIFIFLLVLIVPFFTIRSMIRVFDWKDDYSLFSHDIKYVPDSFDAQNNLGVAQFRIGKINNAKQSFTKSTILAPSWWTSYNNLGVIYQREGNVKKAKELYQKAITNGNYYLAYENLATLRATTENPKDVIPFVLKSISVLPDNEILNRVLAILYIKDGATESAKIYAQKAFLLNQSQDNYLLLQFVSQTNEQKK